MEEWDRKVLPTRQVQIPISMNGFLVLNEQVIRQIFEMFSILNRPVEISGNLSDGSRIEFADVNDLLNFPNVDSRSLVRLSFDASLYERRVLKGLNISFSVSKNDTARALLRGPEEWALSLTQKVFELMAQSIVPSKDPNNRSNFLEFAIDVSFASLQSIVLYWLFDSFVDSSFFLDKPGSKENVVITLWLILAANWLRALFMDQPLRRFERFISLNGEVLIGQGSLRYKSASELIKERKSTLTNTVFIGALISIATGFLVSYFD